MRNQQIIAADDFGIAIGDQGKCDASLARQLPRFVIRVGADGNCLNACGFERSQIALYPS